MAFSFLRMLKMANGLARPTPARRDALFHGQGRSERYFPFASRFTGFEGEPRTKLVAIFSIRLVTREVSFLGATPFQRFPGLGHR